MRSDSLFAFRPRLFNPSGAVVAALAALTLLVGLPTTAWAEGGSVRYHYTELDLPGGNRYALVPVGERKKLSGKLTKSKVFDAFNLLKSDKDKTYGRTSIRISGSFPNNAKVSVKIDPEKSNLALIIMAETVYTLTELGVKEVEFPNYFDGGMTREDVPFDAYALTMPLWRALPPTNATHAQIRLPDGELIPAAEFNKRWKKGDAQLRAAFFSYLKDSQTYTVGQVLRLLPDLGIEYTDKVIPLLEHDSSSIRKRALSVLENHRNDEAVLSAVYKMMNADEDDALARSAAEFLGKAKSDKMNVHEDLFLLDRGSEEEAIAATEALGKRKGDARVVESLYAHLTDERAKVASASADALEALDADERQLAALDDKKIDEALRLTIARTLGEDDSDESKLVGLTYVANTTQERSAELAIRKIGKLSSDEARRTVEGFLSADARRKRLTAADVLVERGENASLTALAKAVSKGKDARELEEKAYELLAKQSLDTVLQNTDSRNKVIKRLAYRAMGEKGAGAGSGARVFDKLAQGAESPDAAIRGASARAVGAFANDKALAILKELAVDKNADVRAGVAYGLSNYKKGEMFETLEQYLDDSSPDVVAAAIAAMEQRSEATKWDKLTELTSADNARVRANALKALSKLVSREDKQSLRTVINMLSGAVNDDDRIVQLTAIRELATFKDDNATTGIAIQLNSEDPSLRVAAIEALGKTGHASATELVASVLQDPNPDIRRAAIVALGDLADKSAESELKAVLDKEEDPDLKELIQRTLRKI